MKRIVMFLLTAGCVIGSGKYPRPRDLPTSTLVDRLRVLAVRSDPPEIRPGDTATFSALVVDPTGTIPTVVWAACPPDQSSGFGCAVDLGGFDPATADLATLQEAGIIGIQPGFEPAYTAPQGLLDTLAEDERAEGVNVTVQVAAFPPEAFQDADAELDFNAVEVAYKRLVVSEAETPNQNPDVGGFTVDGGQVAPSEPPEIDAGSRFTLGILLPDASVESYRFETAEGTAEERVEEPYVAWYCDGGTVLEPYTLYPYLEADILAPEDAASTLTCWAVVRDRRGGMAWASQTFTIR